MGGSDMMESAALGKCTIFGPHAFNFKQTIDDLLKNKGAIEVQNSEELTGTIQKCLSNPEYTAEIARNGREIIRKNQGATQRTINHIAQLIKPTQAKAGSQ
jgi:3-deoxy-D-manno-octulosonic-acid transferase